MVSFCISNKKIESITYSKISQHTPIVIENEKETFNQINANLEKLISALINQNKSLTEIITILNKHNISSIIIEIIYNNLMLKKSKKPLDNSKNITENKELIIKNKHYILCLMFLNDTSDDKITEYITKEKINISYISKTYLEKFITYYCIFKKY